MPTSSFPSNISEPSAMLTTPTLILSSPVTSNGPGSTGMGTGMDRNNTLNPTHIQYLVDKVLGKCALKSVPVPTNTEIQNSLTTIHRYFSAMEITFMKSGPRAVHPKFLFTVAEIIEARRRCEETVYKMMSNQSQNKDVQNQKGQNQTQNNGLNSSFSEPTTAVPSPISLVGSPVDLLNQSSSLSLSNTNSTNSIGNSTIGISNYNSTNSSETSMLNTNSMSASMTMKLNAVTQNQFNSNSSTIFSSLTSLTQQQSQNSTNSNYTQKSFSSNQNDTTTAGTSPDEENGNSESSKSGSDKEESEDNDESDSDEYEEVSYETFLRLQGKKLTRSGKIRSDYVEGNHGNINDTYVLKSQNNYMLTNNNRTRKNAKQQQQMKVKQNQKQNKTQKINSTVNKSNQNVTGKAKEFIHTHRNSLSNISMASQKSQSLGASSPNINMLSTSSKKQQLLSRDVTPIKTSLTVTTPVLPKDSIRSAVVQQLTKKLVDQDSHIKERYSGPGSYVSTNMGSENGVGGTLQAKSNNGNGTKLRKLDPTATTTSASVLSHSQSDQNQNNNLRFNILANKFFREYEYLEAQNHGFLHTKEKKEQYKRRIFELKRALGQKGSEIAERILLWVFCGGNSSTNLKQQFSCFKSYEAIMSNKNLSNFDPISPHQLSLLPTEELASVSLKKERQRMEQSLSIGNHSSTLSVVTAEEEESAQRYRRQYAYQMRHEFCGREREDWHDEEMDD